MSEGSSEMQQGLGAVANKVFPFIQLKLCVGSRKNCLNRAGQCQCFRASLLFCMTPINLDWFIYLGTVF